MNPSDKIPDLKEAMPNDPVVEILGDLCKQTKTTADNMVLLNESGMTLRYTRIAVFFLMFFIGMIAGGTIVRSHYEKPDSLAPFHKAGVRIIIADDEDTLTLVMRGSTMKSVRAEYDDQKNKVGFMVVYGKEQQP